MLHRRFLSVGCLRDEGAVADVVEPFLLQVGQYDVLNLRVLIEVLEIGPLVILVILLVLLLRVKLQQIDHHLPTFLFPFTVFVLT